MIFPGFPGVLPFFQVFQVFQVEWEPWQGKVMFSHACASHSVHCRHHGYSVTVHPCYGAVGTYPTGMLSFLSVLLIFLFFNSMKVFGIIRKI